MSARGYTTPHPPRLALWINHSIPAIIKKTPYNLNSYTMATLTNEKPRLYDRQETRLEITKEGKDYSLTGDKRCPIVSVGDLEYIAIVTAQIVYNTIKSMPLNDCTEIIITATHN